MSEARMWDSGGGSWLSGVFWKETRLMFVEVRVCLMAGLHGVDLSQLVSLIVSSLCGRFEVCVCEGLEVSVCVSV